MVPIASCYMTTQQLTKWRLVDEILLVILIIVLVFNFSLDVFQIEPWVCLKIRNGPRTRNMMLKRVETMRWNAARSFELSPWLSKKKRSACSKLRTVAPKVQRSLHSAKEIPPQVLPRCRVHQQQANGSLGVSTCLPTV